MNRIQVEDFVNKRITGRNSSLFEQDILNNFSLLSSEIKNKSILVIGGAGTIGKSFIKEILQFKPKKIVIVDTNENGLTEITRDLRSDFSQKLPDLFFTYPMNFGDDVFYKMCDYHGKFDIVANFAAHKHVRSEKDIFSIQAMLENNVLNAKKLLDYLKINKPSHFFCVSTDKAANPVNVMGASKKLMEDIVFSYSNSFKITTARFANVAFSNGSLLEGFINRINSNQPISCPSDVKRFFVSIKESGQICMLSCILGNSGEIYYPKLNENNLISFKDITISFFNELNIDIDLCKSENEARLKSNSLIKKSYPIFFFKSNTSGEKLYEEFYSENDIVDENSFVGLGIIKEIKKIDSNKVDDIVEKLNTNFKSSKNNKKIIINLMNDILKNFNHIETGKNLDQKM